jgi:hypothetical protein
MKKTVLSLLLLAFATFANAELNGKKVIYVHGFQPETLINPFLSVADRERGGREQAGQVLTNVIDDYIYFDSKKRLTQNATSLRNQVRALASNGTCSQGCYFVTYSTGDLVTRYIQSRLGQWGVSSNDFRILLTLDYGGAGGGTEGADAIVGIAQGNFVPDAVKRALSFAFFGLQFDLSGLVGIINDLRPSIARSHATGNYSAPRLRMAGAKTTLILSDVFIKGGDDGIVPMHSSCGSSRQESVDSCSRSIRVDGKLTSASGPRSFRYNHFPILMAKDMSHTDIEHRGPLVAVNNNRNFGPDTFSVQEKTRTSGWWIFKSTYRTVDKSNNQKVMQFLINEFN